MGMALATEWSKQGAEAAALAHREDMTNSNDGPFDTNADDMREKAIYGRMADDQNKLDLNHKEQRTKRLAEEEELRKKGLRKPLIIEKIREAAKKILQNGGGRENTTKVVEEIYAEHKAPQPNNQKETQNKQLETELNDQYLQLAKAIVLEQADIDAANTRNQANIAAANNLTQADNTANTSNQADNTAANNLTLADNAAATETQIDENKAAAINAEANQEQQQARLEKGHELIIAIIITESLLSSKDHSKKDIHETVDRIEQLRSEQNRHHPLKEIANKEGILTHGMKEKVNKAMEEIKKLEKGSSAQEWRGENAKNAAVEASKTVDDKHLTPGSQIKNIPEKVPTPFNN